MLYTGDAHSYAKRWREDARVCENPHPEHRNWYRETSRPAKQLGIVYRWLTRGVLLHSAARASSVSECKCTLCDQGTSKVG